MQSNATDDSEESATINGRPDAPKTEFFDSAVLDLKYFIYTVVNRCCMELRRFETHLHATSVGYRIAVLYTLNFARIEYGEVRYEHERLVEIPSPQLNIAYAFSCKKR